VKTRHLFALLSALLLFAACSEDKPSQPPAGDTEKPTISFIKPVYDQRVSEQILDIEFAASDNVGVVKIELFLGTQIDPIVVLTSEPWVATYDVSALQPGEHTLSAKAYDAAGNTSNRVTVTFFKVVEGVFSFQFTAGKQFVYDRWDLDENNQKIVATQTSVQSIMASGEGTALGGFSNWWRMIDTRASGAKDTVIARIDENGNLQTYGFATTFIRRFVNGMIAGGFPITMPDLPPSEWTPLAVFNTSLESPAEPGISWNMTPPAGIDIPVAILTANVKIRGEFVERGQQVTIQGKTITMWHARIVNTITILGSESEIVVNVWYSDDPSARIQLVQESTILNLVITDFPLEGDRWELVSWQ